MKHKIRDLLSELEQRKAIAWLWDFDRHHIVWATKAGFIFWHEPTLLDLIARKFGPQDETISQFDLARDNLVSDDWIQRRLIFRPENQAVQASCKLRAHPLSDGRDGLAVEIEGIDDRHSDLSDKILSKSSNEKDLSIRATAPNVVPLRGYRNSENKNLQSFLEAIPQAIFRVTQEGEVTAANSTAHDLFIGNEDTSTERGIPPSITGNSLASFFDSKTRTKIEEYFSNYGESFSGKITFNRGCSLAHKLVPHGTMVLTIVPAIYDNRPHFYGILYDRSFELAREDNLKKAREEAQSKNRQKSEFVANVSHEMRTPLNAIIGFSEIIAKEQMGPTQNDRYVTYASDIHKISLHLLSLVDDLLDLAKIESGKLELEISDVDVGTATKECVNLIEPLANKANLSVKSKIAPDLPHVAANERSLRQILINLISNAIKFSPPHDEIKVSATLKEDGSLAMCVQDRGVGMSDADLKIALEPFGKIHRRNTKNPNLGTGLGLPLAKALAEANRAEFDIVSAPGKGTMVQLTFPSTLVLAE